LAEQTPFDAASFSYTFPLLGQVMIQGGTRMQPDDDQLEQITLALDIINFHCGECLSNKFKR
jgi:hypothetical protein